MKTFRLVRHSIKLLGLKNGLHLMLLGLRHTKYVWLTAQNIAMSIAALVLMIGGGTVLAYGHRPVLLAGTSGHVFNKPVTFSFNRPIKANVSVQWHEKVEGTWQIKRSFGGIERVSFTPKAAFTPGQSLHAEFTNVEPIIDIASGTKQQQEVEVGIEKMPALVAQTPAKDAKDVQITGDLTVRLARANHGLRKLVVKNTDLPVDESPTSTDDVTFTWKLKQPLEQSKHYEADIIDANQPADKRVVGRYVFDTVTTPQVTMDFSGFILSGSVVSFTFDKAMNATSSSLENGIPGNGEWVSATKYQVTVGGVDPGKSYTLTVKKGAISTDGGMVLEDKVFTVSTPGHVTVVSAQPSGSRVPLQNAVVLAFDQPVDHTSAERAFSISPQVDGSFSWSGNTLTFRPGGFQYQTTYIVALAAGIIPAFGLPGTAYSMSFTTTYETIKLGVPQYYQTHALSCEESSLRMALALYGIATTDDEVLSKVGYAPQPRDTITNSWQDPNEMFVGNVDGTESTTGWGAYAAPIAKAARTYGRTAEVLMNPSVQQVSAAIHAGNPVVVWGVIGGAAVDDSWNTTTSGVVHAAKNAHVRVVYGVDGTSDNPVNFYLRDPLKAAGSLTWSAAKLQSNMDAGGKQAVIVR